MTTHETALRNIKNIIEGHGDYLTEPYEIHSQMGAIMSEVERALNESVQRNIAKKEKTHDRTTA